MTEVETRHLIEIDRVPASCCSHHTTLRAECSCGWKDRPLRWGYVVDSAYIAEAVQSHKINTLLEAAGITFEVESSV